MKELKIFSPLDILETILMLGDYDSAYVPLDLGLMCLLPFSCGEI